MKHDLIRPCHECPFAHPTVSGRNFSNQYLRNEILKDAANGQPDRGCHLGPGILPYDGTLYATEDAQACYGRSHFEATGKRFHRVV